MGHGLLQKGLQDVNLVFVDLFVVIILVIEVIASQGCDQLFGKLDLGHAETPTEHENVVVTPLDKGGGELGGHGLVAINHDDQFTYVRNFIMNNSFSIFNFFLTYYLEHFCI